MGLVSFNWAHPQNFSRDFGAGGISLYVTQRHYENLKIPYHRMHCNFRPVVGRLRAAAMEKPARQLPTLTKKSQFEELKGGDKVVLVCKMCDTVNVFDIKDKKHAMALCKEGRMIHCQVCKKKYKVTWTPRQIRRTDRYKLTIVDEKGKPCMFLAKLS